MLSQDTKDALAQALDAVIAELGDAPEAADLRDALTAASDALDSIDAGDAPHADAEKESPAEEKSKGEEPDPYSFDDAEKQMTEKRGGR